MQKNRNTSKAKRSAKSKKVVTLPDNVSVDLSINQWCVKRGICRATFYKLDEVNNAPDTIKIGRRRTITAAADAAWEAKQAAASQA